MSNKKNSPAGSLPHLTYWQRHVLAAFFLLLLRLRFLHYFGRHFVRDGGYMTGKTLSISEAFFPDDRRYEYYLQRLRTVLADQTRAMSVVEIRDAPDSLDPNELPSVEVVIRIAGLKLRNPATGRPLMSEEWLREHFQAWPSQEAFWLALADYLAKSIPENHPEAGLRSKFKEVKSGSPGNLPARADLFVSYQQLSGQLTAAKRWLVARQKRGHKGFSSHDRTEFINLARDAGFSWIEYVRKNDLSLEQIKNWTPKQVAKEILALKYRVDVETIRDRLVRREK
jgi:hypothetical protein